MTYGKLCGFALALCAISPLAARAGINDLLIGIDGKTTYDANGQENGPPGKAGPDAVLVMDISDPAHPRIRASLPLMNTLLGPPSNLQITPDGKLGLVANSVIIAKNGDGWKVTPDNKLYVIDLGAKPKLIQTLTVGLQPSGLAISRKGDMALIANRAGKSVSMLAIDGNKVTQVAEIPIGEEVSSVAISPDGRRAFATLNLVNRVAVLAIDGHRISYDKALDIPAAVTPFNIDMTADGKYAVVSNNGAPGNNGDAEVTIAAVGPHPHVVQLMTPGHGPEGFAISPDGKWAASPLLLGSSLKHGDYAYTRDGELALMSIGSDGALTVTSRAKLGALPEPIAFNPQGDYIYVGNFDDRNWQTFHIENGKLVPVGTMSLPGQPASARGPAR